MRFMASQKFKILSHVLGFHAVCSMQYVRIIVEILTFYLYFL